ncbi:hypothetical protein QQF64_034639 [Cirrhinus molitorella]|uniref:Uncharacterized protein n=1 Tax=Cirrhinus molitorella TaxID=172907 RepID=A0ABR3L288_9TELE
MKFYLILAVHCCLTLVDSAPLQKHELTRAVETGMSLAKKILSDIPAVHEACVKTAILETCLLKSMRCTSSPNSYTSASQKAAFTALSFTSQP